MFFTKYLMKSNRNIILIASITAVLGFGILAFQTDNVSAYGLMDSSSEILDLEGKGEATTLAKPISPGKKDKPNDSSLAVDKTIGENRIKCSVSSILKCTVLNSGDGLNQVTLLRIDGSPVICDISDVKDGAARASVSTRNNDNPAECDYQPFFLYELDVVLAAGDRACFIVTSTTDSLSIAKCS